MTSFRRISAIVSDYVVELRRIRGIGAIMRNTGVEWSCRGGGCRELVWGERGMKEVVVGEGEDGFESWLASGDGQGEKGTSTVRRFVLCWAGRDHGGGLRFRQRPGETGAGRPLGSLES